MSLLQGRFDASSGATRVNRKPRSPIQWACNARPSTCSKSLCATGPAWRRECLGERCRIHCSKAFVVDALPSCWPARLCSNPAICPENGSAVRQREGLVHGFLVLHTLDGNHLADGDLVQVARGNRVTTQLVYHFKDGSVHDETATYSQSGSFRLLSYHLVQKGPAFKTQMDFSIDASSGQVTIRHSGDDGKEEVISERPNLPPDIANGIVLTILKNIRPETPRTTVSFVAATPKPRLVKLQIVPQGEETFTTGGARRTAMKYAVKVDLGGVQDWWRRFWASSPQTLTYGFFRARLRLSSNSRGRSTWAAPSGESS